LRLSRGWLAALTVSSALAAGIGFSIGLHGVTIDPPAPAALCPMIRAEIMEALVPGHRAPEEQSFSDPNRPWFRGTGCVVDNGSANLDVGLMRFGRAQGRDPRDMAHRGMLHPFNRELYPVALGDEAWYFLEYEDHELRDVYLMSRAGTLVVQVYLAADSMTEDYLLRSAITVAQEVLSRL
jgi:hypothetical protein